MTQTKSFNNPTLARMSRRFTNPKPSMRGRAGHPAGEADENGRYRMVLCAGARFGDQALGCEWVVRLYLPYQEWPEMEVWTKSMREPSRHGITALGVQQIVPAESVADEVREFGLAQVVKFRLQGRVKG